jgi:uncharacterized protein (TIGR02266 family)
MGSSCSRPWPMARDGLAHAEGAASNALTALEEGHCEGAGAPALTRLPHPRVCRRTRATMPSMPPEDDPEPSPLPREPSGSNRRRFARIRLQLLVQFRFDSLDDFAAEYASDLSAGGIFLKTDQPREQGTFVFLQFSLRDGSRIIEGLGRVVRVVPPGVPGRTAGMGIEFVNLDADSTAVLEEIVARRLAGPR